MHETIWDFTGSHQRGDTRGIEEVTDYKVPIALPVALDRSGRHAIGGEPVRGKEGAERGRSGPRPVRALMRYGELTFRYFF